MEIRTIGEGITDEEVVRSIVLSFTQDKNLSISALWPKDSLTPAGWTQVFHYCSSQEFRDAFPFTDCLIVQIDTDIFRKGDIPAAFVIPGIQDLSVSELVEQVELKLIRAIGEDFYRQHHNQILFAIAVDEIECWLLPAYYPTQSAKAGKTTGCIPTLNEALKREEDFTIAEKSLRYYQKMCKRLKKRSDLQKFAALNPSLGIFLAELAGKLPQEA